MFPCPIPYPFPLRATWTFSTADPLSLCFSFLRSFTQAHFSACQGNSERSCCHRYTWSGCATWRLQRGLWRWPSGSSCCPLSFPWCTSWCLYLILGPLALSRTLTGTPVDISTGRQCGPGLLFFSGAAVTPGTVKVWGEQMVGSLLSQPIFWMYQCVSSKLLISTKKRKFLLFLREMYFSLLL